jgi:hypothetical protein
MPTKRKLIERQPENATQLRDWLSRVDDRFMGTPLDIDPHDAIIHAIRVTAGEVKYCDAQISRLHQDELFERPLETSIQQLPNGKWVIIEEKRNVEVISRWVVLRDEALANLVRYSKWALEVGIDERRVRVAERVADVIAPLLNDLALDLDLTDEQRELLPGVIGKRLRALEAATTPESQAA